MSNSVEFGSVEGRVVGSLHLVESQPSVIDFYKTKRANKLAEIADWNSTLVEYESKHGHLPVGYIEQKSQHITDAADARIQGHQIFEFVKQVAPLSPDLKELAPGIRRIKRRFLLENEAVEASFVIVEGDENGGDKVLIHVSGIKSFFETGPINKIPETKEMFLKYDKSSAGAVNIENYQIINPATNVDTDFYEKVSEAAFKRNITKGVHPERGYRLNDEWRVEKNLGPEGMTLEQEKLALMMFDTKVVAPIGKRHTNPDGSYTFYQEAREVSILEFAQDQDEFSQADHLYHPELQLSPYYFNFKNLPTDFREQCVKVFREMGPVDADFITGIPNVGNVLARDFAPFSGALYTEVFNIENIENRSYILPINGIRREGESICLIDDLLAQGNRKAEAILAARKAGMDVRQILFLIKTQEKHQLPEDLNIKWAMTLEQLLKYGKRLGKVSSEQYKAAMKYSKLRDKLKIIDPGEELHANLRIA